MDHIFKILSRFFEVDTVIGLVSAIIVGIIILILKNNRLTQIKSLIKEVGKENVRDVIIRLDSDLGFDLQKILLKVKDENKIVDMVKQSIRDKKDKFVLQIKLIWGGVILLTIIILVLIISDHIAKQNSIITNVSGTGNIVNIYGKPIKQKEIEKKFSTIGFYTWFTVESINIKTKNDTTLCKLSNSNGQNTCYKIQRNSVLALEIDFFLNLDFKGQGLLFPIGIANTWNNTIVEISDGMDIAIEKPSGAYKKKYSKQINLEMPQYPGKHYIVIMTGAVMTVDQLFYFNSIQQQNKNDFWHISFDEINRIGKRLSGKLRHSYIHPDYQEEETEWPFISICIEVI